MLKAKNIMIIFIVNYLLILLACCLLEIIFIGSNAQEAQLLMRTAADMALEQVQATDDFFITGGGYLLDNQDGYKLTVNTGSKFEKVNLFPAYTGLSNHKDNVGTMYNMLFGNGRMTKFINDSISNGSSVLSPSFVAGAVFDITTENMSGNNYTLDEDNIQQFSGFRTNWYYVPKLYQMGLNTLNIDSSMVKDYTKTFGLGNKDVDINTLINSYELNRSNKISYNQSGEAFNYYVTPISLGITYINEDLLQALYINNLDLLMRCKYMQRDDYNLQSSDCGNGVLRSVFYPELTDTSTLSQYNPINNGSFTFLRGHKRSNTGENSQLFEGTVKPKVEYIVIDMYNNSQINNEVLQYVISPKFTKDTSNSMYFQNTSEASLYQGKTLTGNLLKQIDRDVINNYKNITGLGINSSNTLLDHKPIVIAKVTFYADFIIPYSTVSLREMRGREDGNSIGARTLFNAFSSSPTNGSTYISGNYVDLQNITDSAQSGYGRQVIYPTDYYNDVTGTINNYKRLNGTMNSDAMAYTTFFAITP